MMSIGEKIRDLRKKRGMSQEELAEALQVSRQTIYKWENDLTMPDASNLKALTRVLKVSYEELLEDKKTKNATKDDSLDKGVSFVRKHWKKSGYILLLYSLFPAIGGLIFVQIFSSTTRGIEDEFGFGLSTMSSSVSSGMNMMVLIPMLIMLSGIVGIIISIVLIVKDRKENGRT